MKKIILIATLTLGLTGCETLDTAFSTVDDAFTSVNDAFSGGLIEDSPAAMCAEIRSNAVRAEQNYKGRRVEATGSIVMLEKNIAASIITKDQFDARIRTGNITFATLVNGVSSITKLKAFNVGETATIAGRVESVRFNGGSCFVWLKDNAQVTK